MVTEITPKLHCGFFLDPINATRIKDSLNEQVKKVNGGRDGTYGFEVKFANGAVSEPESLDEVLSGENYGMRRVVRLVITVSADDPDNGVARVRFSDTTDQGSPDETPLSYYVKSNDQDWAFITASTIDERLEKVKSGRFLNYIMGSSSSTALIMTMLIVMLVLSLVAANAPDQKAKLELVRKTYPDPLDFFYHAELLRIDSSDKPPGGRYFFVIFFLAMFSPMAIFHCLKKWTPRQTFYWGDACKVYDRKMSIIKIVATGVVLAGVVGLAVNFLSAHLF